MSCLGGGSHSIQEHKAQNYEQHPSVPPAIADCIIFYWLKKCGVFHIAIVQVLLRCRAVPTTVLVRMDMIWIGVESMHDEQCHLARE